MKSSLSWRQSGHEENHTQWDDFNPSDLSADRQTLRYSGQVMAIEKQL